MVLLLDKEKVRNPQFGQFLWSKNTMTYNLFFLKQFKKCGGKWNKFKMFHRSKSSFFEDELIPCTLNYYNSTHLQGFNFIRHNH